MFNISDLSFQQTEASRELLNRQLDVLEALSSSGTGDALMKRLEDCVERAHGRPLEPCKSPACAYCAADFLSPVYDKAVALADAHRNLDGTFGVRGAIWSRSFFTSSGSLDSIRLGHIQRWHAADLRKIEGCPVIAGLNPMYSEDSAYGETVSILCRFVALGSIDLTLEEFQERLGDRTAVIQIEPLTDPRSQLKSLIAFEASRKVTIEDRCGHVHTGQLPLRRRHRSEVALWLDQYRLSDRMILKGFRRQGDLIVPIQARHKRQDGE